MSLVRSFVRRQEGFEFIRDYDVALHRLKCYSYDVYRGISPNTNAPDYNPEPPVFACRFSTKENNEHILALANEDGKIALQDTSVKGEPDQLLEGTQAHFNAIFDVAWMPGELKLVTASGDHTAKLWDVSRSEIKQIQYFHAHTRSVKTAVFRHEDKATFATGARDGTIMIWDIRANHSDQPKPDNCISNAHSIVASSSNRHRKGLSHMSCVQSITSLAFQDDFSLLSCAAGDGMIKVWDLRKNYTVHKKNPLPKHIMHYAGSSARNGFSSLLVCPSRLTLYASCMDNIIYAYNISSYNPKPVAEFYGHQNCTYYVKTCLSPDGRYLASGSSDELAYIWHTKRSGGPIIKLSGHTEEVTCIAWCTVGETKIVTCSDDACHRIWRIGFEHKVDNEEVEIRGQAEAVVSAIALENSKLETTPTTSRRYMSIQDHTPGSDNTPSTTPESIKICNQQLINFCKQHCSSGVKRTYSQMAMGGSYSDGKFKTILSPIQENMEMATKRMHIETRGARRLFSPNTDKTTIRDKVSELDEPSTSSSISENKTAVIQNQNTSFPFSPTLNLPNFVIDGTAPHLQMSPEKFKENVDWLTKIREKYKEQKMRTSLEQVSNPKAVTPARRTGRSKSMEPQKGSKTSMSSAPSLLDFFKIGNKDCDKNICSENSNTLPSPTIS